MNGEKNGVANSDPSQSIFVDEAGVKKVRAGSMSMIVGVSEIGEPLELEKDNYPAVPPGVGSDYDSWLG